MFKVTFKNLWLYHRHFLSFKNMIKGRSAGATSAWQVEGHSDWNEFWWELDLFVQEPRVSRAPSAPGLQRWAAPHGQDRPGDGRCPGALMGSSPSPVQEDPGKFIWGHKAAPLRPLGSPRWARVRKRPKEAAGDGVESVSAGGEREGPAMHPGRSMSPGVMCGPCTAAEALWGTDVGWKQGGQRGMLPEGGEEGTVTQTGVVAEGRRHRGTDRTFDWREGSEEPGLRHRFPRAKNRVRQGLRCCP